MKIIILHGDDERKLYERLSKFVETAKERSWEVDYLDDGSIKENLSSSSLFGNERFFILRDIKRLGKSDLEWLNKHYADLSGNLIIYHEGVLSVTFLKSLPKDIKIEEFKLPKIIYSFLEGLITGNSEKSIKLMHQVVERDPVEYVFALIAKNYRDLYWVKVDPTSLSYPSWRVGKLKSQSSKFSEEKLKDIIEQLAQIDIDVKTSKADLLSSLDLMILKQLE